MIDTDKYEGHTPAPWKFTDFDPLHLWGESPIISGGEGYSQNEADWKLIADAPLLLEEVKRLREQYTELREALVGDSPNWTHEELVEKALDCMGGE